MALPAEVIGLMRVMYCLKYAVRPWMPFKKITGSALCCKVAPLFLKASGHYCGNR
jgi:hypothetical protein